MKLIVKMIAWIADFIGFCLFSLMVLTPILSLVFYL